jgi:hypothetical protein
MRRKPEDRDVEFRVQDDHLEMTVTFRGEGDRGYTHRCTREVYREVAFGVEARAAGGTTLKELAEAIDEPFTQISVALAFMKERGCVEVRHRRTYPASGVLYEDAMIEYLALAEGRTPEVSGTPNSRKEDEPDE